MLAKEFLIKQIPLLKPSDTGYSALSLMDECKLKHLPVVEEGKYMFLLAERDIFVMTNMKSPIENTSRYAPYVTEETPVLEALHVMSDDQLALLPVINQEGIYEGAVTLPVLIEKMAELTNAGANGALIALELNSTDYVLSEIVRLVEANNAKILCLLTYPVKTIAKLVILLKIDLEDASPVLRSLERFNFNVLYCSQKKGMVNDIMKNRLEELMYYIEM